MMIQHEHDREDKQDQVHVGRYRVSWAHPSSELILNLGGTLAAVIVAISVYRHFPSVWLAMFVVGLVSSTIAALPAILNGPRKLQHTTFYTLRVIIGVTTIGVSRQFDASIDKAALLGLVATGVAQALLHWLIFPPAPRDQADRSWLHEDRWGEPGPYDLFPLGQWRRPRN